MYLYGSYLFCILSIGFSFSVPGLPNDTISHQSVRLHEQQPESEEDLLADCDQLVSAIPDEVNVYQGENNLELLQFMYVSLSK